MAPYGKTEERFRNESSVVILRTIVDIHVFPLLVETALLAVFTVQTIYFVYHRCSTLGQGPTSAATQPPHRRPHVNLMLCLSIFMYLLALAYWVLDVVIMQQELLVFWPELISATPRPDPYQTLTQMLGASWYAQAVLQGFIWTAGDGIALWRAYAVLGRPRWLGIVIGVLLLLELGVYTEYLVFYLHVLPNPPRFIEKSNSGVIVVAPYLAAASITVTVQVFATSLIAHKAWMVWKNRQGLFSGPGRVFRTLAILIESGVVYTLLWVWYILATNDAVFSWRMTAWTEYYSIPLMAMYPTLVVMVVTMQDSALTANDNLPYTQQLHSHARHIETSEKLDSE